MGTVLADDPALTVRHVEGRDPIRVVLDADLRTPPDAAVLDQAPASSAETLLFHAHDADPSRREALSGPAVELIPVSRDARGVDLERGAEAHWASGTSCDCWSKAARTCHGTFLDLGLADRAAIFIAPRILGDADAISFAAGSGVESIERAWRLVRTRVQSFGSDWLVSGDFERMQ